MAYDGVFGRVNGLTQTLLVSACLLEGAWWKLMPPFLLLSPFPFMPLEMAFFFKGKAHVLGLAHPTKWPDALMHAPEICCVILKIFTKVVVPFHPWDGLGLGGGWSPLVMQGVTEYYVDPPKWHRHALKNLCLCLHFTPQHLSLSKKTHNLGSVDQCMAWGAKGVPCMKGAKGLGGVQDKQLRE